MKTAIKLTALAAVLACGVIVSHAGNAQPQGQDGAVLTEQRPVGAFSAIELAGPWRVVIEAQGKPSLSLTGERKELDEIETEVRGDTLVVRARGRNGIHFYFGVGKHHDEPTVHITAAALRNLRMSGSGDVELNHLRADAFGLVNSASGDLVANGTVRQLNVNNSGSGDLDLRGLQAADVTLDMNSSGDVQLAGLTNTLSAKVDGSGDLNAENLHAARVEVRMHASGDVHLSGSSRELRLETSGSGDFDGCGLAVDSANSAQHGSGNACIAGKLRALEAEVTGSGDLSVRGLQGQSARLRLHGPGNVDLAGTVATLNAELSGSGDLDAHGLSAGHADVQVHGAGSASVRVLDQGNAQNPANGSGRLLLVDRSGTRMRQ
jgi:hypothetical protein